MRKGRTRYPLGQGRSSLPHDSSFRLPFEKIIPKSRLLQRLIQYVTMITRVMLFLISPQVKILYSVMSIFKLQNFGSLCLNFHIEYCLFEYSNENILEYFNKIK